MTEKSKIYRLSSYPAIFHNAPMPVEKLLLAILFLASGFAASSAQAEDSLCPLPQHIAGKAAAEKNVAFKFWKSRILIGQSVGTLHYSATPIDIKFTGDLNNVLKLLLSDAFSNISKKCGYTIAGQKASSFDADKFQYVDITVGASLLDFDETAHNYDEKMDGSLRIKLKWEMLSESTQKVIFSQVIETSDVVPAEKPVPAKEFYFRVINKAVNALLSHPDYLPSIENDGIANQSATPHYPPLHISPGNVASGNVEKNGFYSLIDATATIQNSRESGSGFYIGSDGYILTNRHVVQNSKYVKVKLLDGRQAVGEVIRSDAARDVALVKTDISPSITLRVGSSRQEAGQPVYALGSPYGETNSGTLTAGIFSANRAIQGRNYLQSDAAINPGSSGGPLLDKQGKVIGIAVLGINNEKALSFFIPIEEALASLAITIKN